MPPTVLKNGAQKEFRILSSRDGPRDAKWWAETCFLVHALSDGDRSTVEAAIQKSKAGDEAVLMTGRGSVTNELYARLIHLGYMAADHETVPEELREMLEGHTLTGYGSEYAPDFSGGSAGTGERCRRRAWPPGGLCQELFRRWTAITATCRSKRCITSGTSLPRPAMK
ncbi:hypothetical protein QW131_13475 [Roseibium salinum]|nr:hypothetical protein [Roseibium salinum]